MNRSTTGKVSKSKLWNDESDSRELDPPKPDFEVGNRFCGCRSHQWVAEK